MSCDFFSDEERLLLSVITRMMKKENKKIKDAKVGEKVKQSRNVGGGDTEKPSESEMTVHCVTCGQDLHTRTAIRHMERCYNKYESQTSFASKFKTQIKNHRKFNKR